MSFSKKFHWLEIFEYWPSNSSYFCKKHPQFTSIPIHLCLFHSSWRQGLQKFVFSLALQWIIFSKKVTTMTPLIGGWLWGVITVTFFDKMSCRRARVLSSYLVTYVVNHLELLCARSEKTNILRPNLRPLLKFQSL